MKLLLSLMFFLFPLASYADEEKSLDFRQLQLEKPIWSVYLNSADWLFDKKEKSNSIGFISLSNSTNTSSKLKSEQSTDIGKMTRAVPLYIAERTNIETNCQAINYVTYIQDQGAALFGKEVDPKNYTSALKNETQYLVVGDFRENFIGLQSKIIMDVYRTKDDKKIFSTVSTSHLQSPDEASGKASKDFISQLITSEICLKQKYSSAYPEPPPALLGPYISGIAQLLAQTLVQHGAIDADSLWGEDNMLDWYRRLWKHFPESDATKLMYVRGILANESYQGRGDPLYIQNLVGYLANESIKKPVVITKLSPLIYRAAKLKKECTESVEALLKDSSGDYRIWLNNIDCSSNF